MSEHAHPNEKLVMPKWITADYFEPIVEKDVQQFKRIVDFKVVPATQPGENYTSLIVRCFVNVELSDGTNKEMSYILKTTMENAGEGAAMVSSMGLFPKEQRVYEHILPTMQRLFDEAGMKVTLNPHCHLVESTPEHTTFILEDLRSKNYRNADRLNGLDMEHMRCVLRMLAEFHAASVVCYELNGSYGEMFEVSPFNDQTKEMFKEMGKTRHQSFTASMRQWPLENIEYYISVMPDLDQYIDGANFIHALNSNEFQVLNHGDCWVNNIMFRYNDKDELVGGRFVDFQIAKWGTPTQDLWYFIVTSASLDIRVKEFDNFIFIYHERLTECLQKLGYTKRLPTLREIHIQMLKYGFWGVFTSCGVLQATILPPDKDSNMDNLLKAGPEAEAFRARLFTNPYYVRAMCQLLPFLHKKGLLDYQEMQ